MNFRLKLENNSLPIGHKFDRKSAIRQNFDKNSGIRKQLEKKINSKWTFWDQFEIISTTIRQNRTDFNINKISIKIGKFDRFSIEFRQNSTSTGEPFDNDSKIKQHSEIKSRNRQQFDKLSIKIRQFYMNLIQFRQQLDGYRHQLEKKTMCG